MSSQSEARTRRELIDPALEKAGWDVNNPDLYAQPFTNVGVDAIDRWFTDDQADEIMAFAETLAIGG